MRWSPLPLPAPASNYLRGSGLGISALAYVGVDYIRVLSPDWHERLQPVLWTILALAAVSRVPYYKHWPAELRSVLPFVASMLFLLSTLLIEALSVRFVTAVLGLNWHRNTSPLPDTGQWLLLALNEKLPQTVVEILRAPVIGLHHFLMLFVMLAFSVLFDSVKAPGLGLGARYMFTMAIGRFLRTISFLSTILPSARPWCASARYKVPAHPHRWAQKYYVPYASDSNAIRQLINLDTAFDTIKEYTDDKRPDWGSMSFLIDFMRPSVHDASWFSLLKKAGGGCNDLLYSGHVLVAVLTAMAWTEAYGGFSSTALWALVMHSVQREIRERHHYSVDCVVAIYVGILLWKMTGFIWRPGKNAVKEARLEKLEKIQGRIVQAAKDADIDKVREILNEVESGNVSEPGMVGKKSTGMWVFSVGTIFFALVLVFLALTFTSDG